LICWIYRDPRDTSSIGQRPGNPAIRASLLQYDDRQASLHALRRRMTSIRRVESIGIRETLFQLGNRRMLFQLGNGQAIRLSSFAPSIWWSRQASLHALRCRMTSIRRVESIEIRGMLFQLGNHRAFGYSSFAPSIRWSPGILALRRCTTSICRTRRGFVIVDDLLPYLEQSRAT
jgi:hypothetical protein